MFGAFGLNLPCMSVHAPAAPSDPCQTIVFRAPELGTIAISGKDRVSWLNGLITSDVTKVRAGVASYGLALVKIGRILADLWVVDIGTQLLVGTPRDRVASLREHLEKYLMMEDASHADMSSEYAWA